MNSGERANSKEEQSPTASGTGGRSLEEQVAELQRRLEKLEGVVFEETSNGAPRVFRSLETVAVELLALAKRAGEGVLPVSSIRESDRLLLVAEVGLLEAAMAQVTTLGTIVDEESDEGLSAMASAAAHPTRIRLLKELVAGERSAADLGRKVGLEGGPLYHHLNDLLTCGLVEQPERSRYALTTTGRRLLAMLGVVHRDMRFGRRQVASGAEGEQSSASTGEDQPIKDRGDSET